MVYTKINRSTTVIETLHVGKRRISQCSKASNNWPSFLENDMNNLENLINKFNSTGLAFPMIRDPKTGKGSVSLTLLFLSFNIWIISIVGKWAGQLGGVDPSQTLNMFMVTSSLYFARKLQKDPKGAITIEESTDKKE